MFSNNKPQQEALAKEIATETGMVVRQDGHVKAVKFVLASIVHKQEYALKALKLNLKFKNSNYQNLYDFAVKSEIENKPYTISSLFDIYDVDNNPDIKEIIDYDFSAFNENKDVYFEQCLSKPVSINLNKRQEELIQLSKTEKDLDKRREILIELQRITKEIKTKTEKK